MIDLLEQRADAAIRVGPLRNSQLVARKLGTSAMVVLAAPGDREQILATHADPMPSRAGVFTDYPGNEIRLG